MHQAITITLFFVAATSVLGGVNSAKLAGRTGNLPSILGSITAFVVAAWCVFCGVWLLAHT